jgi:bla regulator protein blaR1
MLFGRGRIDKVALILTLAAATALPCVQVQLAIGQTRGSAAASPAATGGAGKLAFDAASVRLSTQEFSLKGVDFLSPSSEAAPPQGGLFSWNVQLPWLINFAYNLRSSQTRREAREALPEWAQESWFTIEARAEGEPSRDDVRQMVRSLLEDRFQLSAHMEKREAEAYALVVAKPGLGLKPHPEGAPCKLPASRVDEEKYPHLYPSYKSTPARCGVFGRELSHGGEHRLEMLNVAMQQVADALGQGLPLLVVDNTGLTGRYDAVLDFGPDGVPSNAESSDEIGLPPLTVALEKQLGLKLVKQNAPIDILVIDHIERLSEN